MVAAVGNNLPCTVAGDNDAVEWFLMECRLSWKSEDYFGIKKMGRGLMGSAKTSNAPKERRTVAVAVFCSINQISLA